MKKQERSAQARRELDYRFRTSDVALMRERPPSGWIKAIRTGLGMTQAALAKRLGVSSAAVAKLELAEVDRAITLAKLSQVAASLDCTVVYAVVPNSSLEETVQRQARRVATKRLGYVDNTMSLEDQSVTPERRAEYLEVYARDLIAHSDIWQ